MGDNAKPDAPAKPHISPSQISTFTKCGEQYRRRYIEKEIIPPGVAMIRGIALHKGAEHNFKPKIESRVDLPKSQIQEIVAASFDKKIAAEGVHLNKDEKEIGKAKVLGASKDDAVAMAGVFSDDLAPTIQPIAVEKKIRIVLKKSTHDLLGVIDVIDDEFFVRDLKSAAKAKNQAEVDRDFQFGFYPIIARAFYGKEVAGVKIDTIVKTKTKVYLQTLTTDRDADDFEAIINRTNFAIDAINAGNFFPAFTGAWWCAPKWCGYYSTCPYVNGKKG